MSTKEDTKMPNDPTNGHAMTVHQPSLLDTADNGWANLSGLMDSSQAAGLDLSIYLHAIRRHWAKAIVLGLICSIVAGIAVIAIWRPTYTSMALIQIGARQERMVAGLGTRSYTNRSDFEVFKLTQQSLVKTSPVLTEALRDDVVNNLTIVKREKPNELAWLKDYLQVRFLLGESEIMSISLKDKSAEETRDVVEAVAKAYMAEIVGKARDRREQELMKLGDLRAEKEFEVRKRRKDLKDWADAHDSADAETLAVMQRIVQMRLGDIQRTHSQIRTQRYRAEAELKGQKAAIEAIDQLVISEYEIQLAANQNAFVRAIAIQLADMQLSQLQSDSIRVTQGSMQPGGMQEILQTKYDETLAELEVAIREMKQSEINSEIARLEIELTGWTDQEALLKGEVKDLQTEVNSLTGTEMEVEMRRKEIERLDNVLASIADQTDALKIELDNDSRIHRLGETPIPKSPDNPEVRWATAILAGVIGFCLPIGLIVVWDTRSKRINGPSDVSKGIGLPVIGSMPKIPSRVIRRLGSPAAADQTWHLRLTESVDAVAASLLRKAELEQVRVILVSSAVGGEGKTTLATQLAMSLARSGRRTILVDFDLRRPAFDEIFALPLEPGVSEILRGETEITDAIHATATENLSVVTAGRWDRQALASLANGAASSLFDELRAECEFMVVDSSPILPVADTRIVSQHVDTVVLSVFRDISQAPKVQAACEILEAFGVSTVEAVVTGSSENPRDRDMNYEPRRLQA